LLELNFKRARKLHQSAFDRDLLCVSFVDFAGDHEVYQDSADFMCVRAAEVGLILNGLDDATDCSDAVRS
jgi:hypothetical protein